MNCCECRYNREIILYQLTHSESYRLVLVKMIEVLTVTLKNDVAKISEVLKTKNELIVNLKYWICHRIKEGFALEETNSQKNDDNLAYKSVNVINWNNKARELLRSYINSQLSYRKNENFK